MQSIFSKVKWYFAEIVIPRYVPAAIVAIVGYLVSLALSHAQLLEPYGITTGQWPLHMEEPSGLVTLIEWSTLGTKLGAALAGLFGVLIMAIHQHTVGNGEINGGRRSTDPPEK